MKSKRIFIIILMICCILINTNVLAATVDPIESPDSYDPSQSDLVGNDKFIAKANVVLGTIRVIGTVIAVISLMVIGIRYMFGSTAEKASYKETMVPYIIGAIMLFAIPNFLGIIYDLVSSMRF